MPQPWGRGRCACYCIDWGSVHLLCAAARRRCLGHRNNNHTCSGLIRLSDCRPGDAVVIPDLRQTSPCTDRTAGFSASRARRCQTARPPGGRWGQALFSARGCMTGHMSTKCPGKSTPTLPFPVFSPKSLTLDIRSNCSRICGFRQDFRYSMNAFTVSTSFVSRWRPTDSISRSEERRVGKECSYGVGGGIL